jgi:hypothetical protein
VAVVAVLNVGESRFGWGVAASALTSLFTTLAGWLAVVMLIRAAAGEIKEGRRPWVLLAAGCACLSVGQTLGFYVEVITRAGPRGLWPVNILLLAGYGLIVGGLFAKARRLFGTRLNVWRGVALALVVIAFGAAFVFLGTKLATEGSGMPAIAIALTLAFPAVDFVIVLLAVYIAATFAGGVAGRPWFAIAGGVILAAVSDAAGIITALERYGQPSAAGASIWGLVAFASVAFIIWGAWYQRLLWDESA